MTRRGAFLVGVALGGMGGLLATRRAVEPRAMEHLDISQRVLAEARGEIPAAMLAARVQERYDELYAHRPRFLQPALRQHLETGILPGLALYQTLREEHDDQEAALAEMDRIFAAWVEHSPKRRLLRLMEHLPDPFNILRISNRWILKTSYPPQGWRTEWVEDSEDCIAYDISDCFYVNVLTAYGAPELTAHFCRGDDLLFGNLPGISWERTKTLGRGDDRCDFRLCRMDASSTGSSLRNGR